jgi:hypothetical protein
MTIHTGLNYVVRFIVAEGPTIIVRMPRNG